MLKTKIIEMIEQGHNNEQIVEATGASNNWVIQVRMAYNSVVAPEDRKPSLNVKPKAGTKARQVYDYMELYPCCLFSEVQSATGASPKTCSIVRHRYFGAHLNHQRAQRAA